MSPDDPHDWTSFRRLFDAVLSRQRALYRRALARVNAQFRHDGFSRQREARLLERFRPVGRGADDRTW